MPIEAEGSSGEETREISGGSQETGEREQIPDWMQKELSRPIEEREEECIATIQRTMERLERGNQKDDLLATASRGTGAVVYILEGLNKNNPRHRDLIGREKIETFFSDAQNRLAGWGVKLETVEPGTDIRRLPEGIDAKVTGTEYNPEKAKAMTVARTERSGVSVKGKCARIPEVITYRNWDPPEGKNTRR
jgi:hypothetical protein